jgi:hypothetical protein
MHPRYALLNEDEILKPIFFIFNITFLLGVSNAFFMNPRYALLNEDEILKPILFVFNITFLYGVSKTLFKHPRYASLNEDEIASPLFLFTTPQRKGNSKACMKTTMKLM